METTTATLELPVKETAAALRAMPRVRSNLPVLGMVRIDEHGVTATDLEATVHVHLDMIGDGALLVGRKDLADKLKAAKGQSTIVLASDGETVRIDTGVSVSEVRGMALTDWPKTPDGDIVPTFQTGAEELAYVSRAISTDDTRPLLCSLAIQNDHAVATDSYRLHLAPVSAGYDENVPRSAILSALKLAGKRGLLTFGPGGIIAGSGLVRFRPVEGDFPKWRTLLDHENRRPTMASVSWSVDTGRLLDAIAAVGSKANAVQLEGDGTTLELVTITEGREARAEIPYTGDPFHVAFDPKYLADLVSGPGVVTFQGHDELKPWAADLIGSGPYGLLMPTRVR